MLSRLCDVLPNIIFESQAIIYSEKMVLFANGYK